MKIRRNTNIKIYADIIREPAINGWTNIRSEENVLGEHIENLKEDPEIDDDMDTLPDFKSPKIVFNR